jgi:hypothetical protein
MKHQAIVMRLSITELFWSIRGGGPGILDTQFHLFTITFIAVGMLVITYVWDISEDNAMTPYLGY